LRSWAANLRTRRRQSGFLLAGFLLAGLLVAAPGHLAAQDNDSREDASFLERQIESALSGDDRDVVIEGFEGLISGQATFTRMTISDSEGVWLTITGAELDWSRLALLRRRLEVNRLSAESIDFARLPVPAETAPAPEASGGFALPELPVSIRIGEISVDTLSLGEPLFGRQADLSISGSAVLDAGTGEVDLSLERLDGEGTFRLAGSFENETDFLDLSLVVDEAADGIIVNLLDIPDTPSLRLVVDGRGPLADFSAEIVLATAGTHRLAGRVATRASGPPDAPERDFSVNLGGDISSLFLPAYGDFFGPSVLLGLDATQGADGTLRIHDLDLQAEALILSVQGELGSDRLPTELSVSGQIAARDGEPVLLPLPGPPVRVANVDLSAVFDAERGDDWEARVAVEDLDLDGLDAESIVLSGTGTIRPTRPDRRFSADLDIVATGFDTGSDAIETALGRDLTGAASLDWSEGEALQIPLLRVEGRDYSLAGSGSVTGFGEGLDVSADLVAEAQDLSVFSGVAGRDLGGAISADLVLAYEALTGQFDVTLDATSRDLAIDQPQADALLAGNAELDLRAVRDETGTRVETFRLVAPNAAVEGAANLTSARSTASVTARLEDAGLILPELSGAVALTADAEMTGDDWTYTVSADGLGVDLSVDGTADTAGNTPRVDAGIELSVADLAAFAELAGRPLSGEIAVSGRVGGLTDLSSVMVDLAGTTDDLVIGQDQADALMSGETTFRVAGSVEGDVPTVETLTLSNAAIDVDAAGSLQPGAGALQANVTVFDTSVVLPGTEGRSTLRLTADEGQEQVWTFDLAAASPLADADASGTLRPFDTPQAIDAEVALSVPDLSRASGLAGRPLSGSAQVSGRVSATSDLEAVDLDLDLRTQDIAIGIAEVDQLLAGQATLVADLSRAGGNVTIRTLDLSAPRLSASVDGDVSEGAGTLSLSASLSDLGIFVPQFPGAVTVDGTARLDGAGTATVDLAATGPGGITAQVTGDTSTSFDQLALRATGRAPLAATNRFIAPNSIDGVVGFDLSVNGPPALSSVTGTVTTSGARVVLPGAGINLQGVAVNVGLSDGQADLSVTAGVEGGGALSVSGPVQLTAPFDGTLAVALDNVVLVDPTLYRTSLSGNLRVDGPLAGGAAITGSIDVGETEISIAGTAAGASGPIPDVIHVDEPADVFQTREFAGLVSTEGGEERDLRPYTLDVTVRAPRVFVRGRGLDTELAGQVRLTGTSTDVVPIGAIELVRGRLNLLGARLRVTEGEIVLEGTLVPVLRLRAVSEVRSDDDVQAFVAIDGPVTDPEITFESEPPLPEDEVLARLLFGTDLANISALQAAQLASAAATLAGGGGPGIVGGIRSGLGIDDLDVRTDEQGRTAVTAGTYLTENLYADVTTRSDGETEINLNFDLTQSVTVTGSTNNIGESRVGIFFRRDY
jgi:translocation and assembly module TamB